MTNPTKKKECMVRLKFQKKGLLHKTSILKIPKKDLLHHLQPFVWSGWVLIEIEELGD